jgi:hypothetical protein
MSISAERPAESGQSFDLADYITPERLHLLTNQRFDSVDTAFFLRDLTDIYARTFDRKYPDLVARQMLPVYSGVDAGAEGYIWRSYDKTAVSKVVDSYSNDFPEVNVKGKEFQSRIVSIGNSYVYSIQDLRKAKMAKLPLETRLAFAAREGIERSVEQLAFFGLQQVPGSGAAQALLGAPAAYNTTDPAMYGFTNFPGLTVTAGTNTWNDSTGTITSTSNATIIADWLKLFNGVRSVSKGIHTPNAVALPLTSHLALVGQPRSPTFTDDNLLSYLLKLTPSIKSVYFTPMLETAGLKQDLATPGPRIMMWEKNDENIELVVPTEFEQFPPQMVNMVFKTACHLRFGGIRVSYPLSLAALDGTQG